MAKHILIIGSPGSGKSVFSAALASAVGKRNRQTLLISGDSRISMLPFKRISGQSIRLFGMNHPEAGLKKSSGSACLTKNYKHIKKDRQF